MAERSDLFIEHWMIDVQNMRSPWSGQRVNLTSTRFLVNDILIVYAENDGNHEIIESKPRMSWVAIPFF